MRLFNVLLTLAIVAFWIGMNTALIRREMQYRDLDLYRQGVTNFLGKEFYRERWMGIYRNSRKIGYTGFIFTKSIADDGVHHEMSLESAIAFDLFGKGNRISVKGRIICDIRMIPESLEADVALEQARIRLEGERRENSFVITGLTEGEKIFEFPYPLKELCLSDGLFPILPISGFQLGQTYEVPIFDPILQTTAQAVVEVKSMSPCVASGLKVDCFELETRYRNMTYTSWVTPDGETIRQEIPPPLGVTLKRESRRAAIRGFMRTRSENVDD